MSIALYVTLGFESPRERPDSGKPGTNERAAIADVHSIKIAIPTILGVEMTGIGITMHALWPLKTERTFMSAAQR